MSTRTVIVGGVAAGMSAATRLRRLDEHMEIIVLERGEYVSFANCGLPYHIGQVISDRDALLLQTPDALRTRFNLDVRTGHEVRHVDADARTVAVRDRATGRDFDLAYDALVLATGASPVRPRVPGIERARVLRDVADMDAILAVLDPESGSAPRSAVVIGGGFVGVEMAENLARRGLDVTVVELDRQILSPLDPEMAAEVAAHLRAHGVGIRTGTRVTEVLDGGVLLDGAEKVPAELVILAAGVAPESGLARQAGLAVDARGGIVVDHAQRTSAPGVYAVGDVATKRDAGTGEGTLVALAQTANRHGRLVADAIAGRTVSAAPVLATAIVGVFGLTAATVGWNEKRLRTAGRPVRVIHTHPFDHASYYPGAESMSLKLLVDPDTDQILGAQGVGRSGVDKRIDVVATAMRGGLRASDLADLELAYAPQYGSAKDPVVMLGLIADNLAAGLTGTVQWHEVDAERDAGTCLLDVRTPAEVAAGAIPGAVAIPLDELRERHGELPGGRVLIYCAAGQRGHTATTMLRQLGHDEVVNLDGGYRTWATATGASAT